MDELKRLQLSVYLAQPNLAVLAVAERIRQSFKERPMLEASEQCFSLSTGLQKLDFSLKRPLEAAVADADKALYFAKEHGRDQCVVFRQELHPS